MHLPLLERVARWNSLFQDDLRDLLQPDMIANDEQLDPLRNVRNGQEEIARFSPLGRLLAANFATYLPDDLLVKDRSLHDGERARGARTAARHELTQYAASLPDDYKLRGRMTKVVLREAFADLLPSGIARRPKTGFGVPLDAWFRGELRDFVRDTLLPSSTALRRYVRTDRVRLLIDDHLDGRTNAGQRLWSLVCFERWLKLLPAWTAPAVTAP
jgi:asparagine synthase (glutamine-hydrolysing)